MPRPDATPAFVSAIESNYVQPGLFVQFGLTTGTLYVWSGAGTQTFNGQSYTGVGQFGMVSSIEEGTDVMARGITLTLSGFDSALITDALSDYQQGLPVIVSFAVFTGGMWLGITAWSGRTDQPTISVTGDKASIDISCENRLVEMNVSVERRYTSEDQQIDYPGDLGFSFVPMIQDITIYWGRHPSSANNFGVQGSG